MLLLKGDVKAALAEIQQEPEESWRLAGLSMAYHALGRRAESDAALDELIGKYEQTMSYNIAYVLAYRGEPDRAFEWLDKAVKYRDTRSRRDALRSDVGEPAFGSTLAAALAPARHGARAARGDQVRREGAELVEVAHRSFDGCP